MLLNCGVGEDSWLLPWTAGRSNQSILKDICPEYPLKDWCWSWNSSTLATWSEELTHWQRPWCWERLRAGEDGDDRGWDGWMASLTQWKWVWVTSGSWWWTGRLGMLQSMGSQRVGHDWATELNRTERALVDRKDQHLYLYWNASFLSLALHPHQHLKWLWIILRLQLL